MMSSPICLCFICVYKMHHDPSPKPKSCFLEFFFFFTLLKKIFRNLGVWKVNELVWLKKTSSFKYLAHIYRIQLLMPLLIGVPGEEIFVMLFHCGCPKNNRWIYMQIENNSLSKIGWPLQALCTLYALTAELWGHSDMLLRHLLLFLMGKCCQCIPCELPPHIHPDTLTHTHSQIQQTQQ